MNTPLDKTKENIVLSQKYFLGIFSHFFWVNLSQCSKKQHNNPPGCLTVSCWVFFSLLGLVTILWRPPTAHNRWNHPGTQFSWSELKQQLGKNMSACNDVKLECVKVKSNWRLRCVGFYWQLSLANANVHSFVHPVQAFLKLCQLS